jgi:hypothetical protein
MMPDLYVLNWKSSYDVMLLMFQSRQQHFAGILICVIFRPGICKNNTFLSTILNLRIISIK